LLKLKKEVKVKDEKITVEKLREVGYEYLGKMCVDNSRHEPNQLWRWRDELIIYDPEEQQVIYRQFNEPRYQCNYTNEQTSDLHVGERRSN
jgi:hypothetical protein